MKKQIYYKHTGSCEENWIHVDSAQIIDPNIVHHIIGELISIIKSWMIQTANVTSNEYMINTVKSALKGTPL